MHLPAMEYPFGECLAGLLEAMLDAFDRLEDVGLDGHAVSPWKVGKRPYLIFPEAASGDAAQEVGAAAITLDQRSQGDLAQRPVGHRADAQAMASAPLEQQALLAAIEFAHQQEAPDAAAASQHRQRALAALVQAESVVEAIVVRVTLVQGAPQLPSVQAQAQVEVAAAVEQRSVPEQTAGVGAQHHGAQGYCRHPCGLLETCGLTRTDSRKRQPRN